LVEKSPAAFFAAFGAVQTVEAELVGLLGRMECLTGGEPLVACVGVRQRVPDCGDGHRVGATGTSITEPGAERPLPSPARRIG
jgi:hypothetical protein